MLKHNTNTETVMSNVRYRKLKTEDVIDGRDEEEVSDASEGSDFVSKQFERRQTRVPWRAILYAAVLLVGGSVLLVLGSLIVTGHLDPEVHGERFWPLILLGGLMFIPGSYYTYFAYKAFTGDPDWSFEEFPDF